MSRRGAGKLIETWEHHRYKDKVNIYLNREDGVFSARYGEHYLNSKSLEELRSDLSKLVEKCMKLEWIPVILIELNGRTSFHRDKRIGPGATTEVATDPEDERTEHGSADFDLRFKRFYLAKQPNGEWLECDIWYSQDVDGKSDRFEHDTYKFGERSLRRLNSQKLYLHGEDIKNFKIPYKCKDTSFNENKQLHYVKYTPQLWSGLNEIAFKVDELIDKLKQLLGSEKGLLLVEGLLNKLLPLEKEK
jgi:hypothetical protein